VIDADYRGPVMVLLFNHSDTDFEGMSIPMASRYKTDQQSTQKTESHR
jgi:hypothetical protein